MKKLFFLMAMVMLMLTSCSINDNPVTNPDPQPKPLSEYTIMYYGNGGANVDRFLLPIISDLYKASPDAYKKVNVVAQYKFSTTENLKKQSNRFDVNTCEMFGSKTVRWAVDLAKTFQEQVYSRNSIYGADNADCTCPDSLTNFIKWAAKAYPAKKYMLILNDHGGGYRPDDDLPEATPANTRGLLYDDGNNSKHFTAKSLHRAITAANVRFETIYMWACLMNNLEYQFELQDLCDYVIASTYSMPAYGGAFNELPEMLSQPSVDIEQALAAYCKADVESWDKAYAAMGVTDDDPMYTDLTVTRTASIPHLGEVLREFTNRLCDTYTNGTKAQQQAIDSCTARTIKVQLNRPNYDAVKYVKSLINALPEVYGNDFYNQMKEAFNNCIVAQNFSKYLTNHNYMVDYSVLLGAEGAYSTTFWETGENGLPTIPNAENVFTDDGERYSFKLLPTDDPQYFRRELFGTPGSWGSTLADTYEQLAFDRAVGWSRWLRLNRQWPNLFCPNDLYFELPMPE